MNSYTYMYVTTDGQCRLGTVQLEQPPSRDDVNEWVWWRIGLHDLADVCRERRVGPGQPLLWCVVE